MIDYAELMFASMMKYSTPLEWLAVHRTRVEQMREALESQDRPATGSVPPPASSWSDLGI
jgi:hypothetical protein